MILIKLFKIQEGIKMKFGIVSYNFYMNFINYGSILQTYALQQALNNIGVKNEIIDYCPDCLLGCDMDNPLPLMKDSRFVSKFGCRLALFSIKEANSKYRVFIEENIKKSEMSYTSQNVSLLNYDGFVCGSDTIWDINEFGGFDDGFYANYPSMKDKLNISYSASLGDVNFSVETKKALSDRLSNFSAIAVREESYIPLLKECTEKPIFCSIDPTLLLTESDYSKLIQKKQIKPIEKQYLLLYSRNYNKEMVDFADKIAKEKHLKVIEISIRTTNMYKHKMAYNTGVEEFLSLVKNAKYVVTNSYHGAIFCMQFRKEFSVFTRTHCSDKILFLLKRAGLEQCLVTNNNNSAVDPINYEQVWNKLNPIIESSYEYLKENLVNNIK